MSEKLIKSKQRVKDFAEVFTPQHIVKDMCDLVPEEMWTSIDTTFLEPACGTGNFLVEILKRKFKLCQSWKDGLRALKSIYGMDIQADNVEEAKGRLFDMYIKQYPKSPAVSGLIAAQILKNNIVCGDFIPEFTRKVNEKKEKSK
jgi:type I restriction-modification system DNA methylase subunit